MENLKDHLIRIIKEKGNSEWIIKKVSQLSEERIQWLKDAAWNEANSTKKYNRDYLIKELPNIDFIVFESFIAEEHKRVFKEKEEENQRFIEETKLFLEEDKRYLEEAKRFLTKYKGNMKRKASSIMDNYFPMGEA